MNPELRFHPAYRELRQAVAELSLVSHVAGTSHEGKVAKDTSDDIGGKRPPGSDQEFKPRAPRKPFDLHEDATDDERRIHDQEMAGWRIEMEAYEDELASWRVCYQRRTPSFFRRELEHCDTEARLIALRDDAREAVAAWQRAPLPRGQEPLSRADKNWKRWVAECGVDPGVLATRFGVTRRYINRVRQQVGVLVLTEEDIHDQAA